jgi:hypothetical protein
VSFINLKSGLRAFYLKKNSQGSEVQSTSSSVMQGRGKAHKVATPMLTSQIRLVDHVSVKFDDAEDSLEA